MLFDILRERNFQKHLRNVGEGHVHNVTVLPSLAELSRGFEVLDFRYLEYSKKVHLGS